MRHVTAALLVLALAACTRGPEETSDGGNRTSEADPSLPTTQTGTPADAEATNGMESEAGMTGTSPATPPANTPAPSDTTGDTTQPAPTATDTTGADTPTMTDDGNPDTPPATSPPPPAN